MGSFEAMGGAERVPCAAATPGSSGSGATMALLVSLLRGAGVTGLTTRS